MLRPSEGSENQTAYRISVYFYRNRSIPGQTRAFQTNGKMSECPPDFKLVPYRRFVDDTNTFCLFENPEHVNYFLEYINGFQPNTNFTVEVENDSTLPFLDVSIFKSNNDFSTSLYRKKTFTGQYTDFVSLSPKKYITNLGSVLVYRAFHICSTYENFHNELCKITGILYKYCFPNLQKIRS